MKLRMAGYESVFLLSQYMGDFHPDAHVNGLSGWSLIALIFRSFSATCLSKIFIVYFYFLIPRKGNEYGRKNGMAAAIFFVGKEFPDHILPADSNG
jgi:hypothetical protein